MFLCKQLMSISVWKDNYSTTVRATDKPGVSGGGDLFKSFLNHEQVGQHDDQTDQKRKIFLMI